MDKENLRSFCHAVAKEGLVKCSSGNASCRSGPNEMIVTQTGAWLENNELGVHCAIRPFKIIPYQVDTRKDINVVLHFQSPYATTLAASGHIYSDYKYGQINKEWKKHNAGEGIFGPKFKIGNQRCDDFSLIPEIPYYIRSIGYIDQFLTPGSKDLANQLYSHFGRGENLVVLVNHGMFVVGRDYNETFQRAVFFELACQIKVHTLSMGIEQTPTAGSTWVTEVKHG